MCGRRAEVVRQPDHSLDHLDGVTVDLGDGTWFNMRTSNTEPLLRLNVEASTSAEVDGVVGQVRQTVEEAIEGGVGTVSATRAKVDLDDTEG